LPYIDFRNTHLVDEHDAKSFALFNVGTRYQPWDDTSLSTSLGTKNYVSKSSGTDNYHTLTWSLSISQRF
jgi:hypothetical protein